MKVQLICVGKTERSYLKEGESEYLKRLKHYCSFEKIEIPELKNAKKMSEDQIKAEEKVQLMCKKLLVNLIIEDYKINKL